MATVEIEVDEVITETDKAYLFSIEGKEVWLPKSSIKDQCEDDDENITSVFISEHLAYDKGLI